MARGPTRGGAAGCRPVPVCEALPLPLLLLLLCPGTSSTESATELAGGSRVRHGGGAGSRPLLRRECLGLPVILAATYLVRAYTWEASLSNARVAAAVPQALGGAAHSAPQMEWPPQEAGDPQAAQKTEARAQAARVVAGGLELRGLPPERATFNGLYTLVKGDMPNGRPHYIKHGEVDIHLFYHAPTSETNVSAWQLSPQTDPTKFWAAAHIRTGLCTPVQACITGGATGLAMGEVPVGKQVWRVNTQANGNFNMELELVEHTSLQIEKRSSWPLFG